ncbi:hypothetical protein jhhlp_000594 [Lomentospora prolificans]|uniref:TFIIS N-terminal domain-containing protein n=1 Tax=Lomentospora prolificans TaxID=41688 RepID=A0A2N3NIY4_9PEZI|nr:hypothetical protein jhhlp_000594 [Lomentospora prolificans]
MSDIESPAQTSTRDEDEAGSPVSNQDIDKISESAGDDKDLDQLSEIDEDQFEDYDPETANIEDRPVEIDEDVARTLKAARRQRSDADKPRKAKEGRREKKKRSRDGDGDGQDEESRPRKSRRSEGSGSRSVSKRASPEEDEDDSQLTPEERRRRALDRALEAAVKGPMRRKKKKDETDLDDPIDDQIADLVVKMEKACEADNSAREAGKPAVEKMKLLPEVVSMLNRNNAQEAVLDPDSGFLRAVRYFLEPLHDGSLPAYSIQREIFNHLIKLPIEKDALLGSGLGKVVFFYTKSKRPEPNIKRIAEKLVGDWSRPILKRTDDYKKRQLETRTYDYQAAKLAQRSGASQLTLSQRPAQSRFEAERERALAPSGPTNRARVPEMPQSYTVAPRSTFDKGSSRAFEHRPIGASGIEAFRKMTQKPRKRG